MLENINPRAPLSQTLNKIPFILQIVIGLIIGIFLAFIFPNDKSIIPTFGTLFVKALKAVAPILVFVLVSSAIARHKKGQQSNMKPIIALYFISMLLSATLALLMSYIFPSSFNILSEHVDNVSAFNIKLFGISINDILIFLINTFGKTIYILLFILLIISFSSLFLYIFSDKHKSKT